MADPPTQLDRIEKRIVHMSKKMTNIAAYTCIQIPSTDNNMQDRIEEKKLTDGPSRVFA